MAPRQLPEDRASCSQHPEDLGIARALGRRVARRQPEFVANQLRQTPLGRIGQSHDIAAAVAFLAFPDLTSITGEIIMVSGWLR